MQSSAVLVALILFSIAPISSAGDYYSIKSKEEVDIFAVVMQAESESSAWTKQELICFDVDGQWPDKKLVHALRRQHLNVRSEAEWHKNFACGFTVRLQPVEFESPEAARVRVSTIDNREINSGQSDIALIIRDGEYSLRSADSRWSITKYQRLRGDAAHH